MTIHALLAALPGVLAQPIDIPDPPPAAPPGKLADAAGTFISWLKWAGLVGAVASGTIAGIMMAVGRRNRNNMAIEAAVGLPWIVVGLAFVLGSASLVSFFVT